MTGSTRMSPDVHATTEGVADGDAAASGVVVASGSVVGSGVGVGLAAGGVGSGDTAAEVRVALGDGVVAPAGSTAEPRHGWAMSSQTTATTIAITSSSTSRRRRYTAGECRLRGVGVAIDPG